MAEGIGRANTNCKSLVGNNGSLPWFHTRRRTHSPNAILNRLRQGTPYDITNTTSASVAVVRDFTKALFLKLVREGVLMDDEARVAFEDFR